MTRPIACEDCPLGRASGEGAGQFCPFVVRTYDRSAILHRAGAPADYVWFLKSGSALRHDPETGRRDPVQVGEFVGLETLRGGRFSTTVSTPTGATVCGATREGMLAWIDRHREQVSDCEALKQLEEGFDRG